MGKIKKKGEEAECGTRDILRCRAISIFIFIFVGTVGHGAAVAGAPLATSRAHLTRIGPEKTQSVCTACLFVDHRGTEVKIG